MTDNTVTSSTGSHPPKKQIIWILCGGPSTEFAVSLSSGLYVSRHINGDRYQARPVVVDRQGHWRVSKRLVSSPDDIGWIDRFFEVAGSQSIIDSDMVEILPLPNALEQMIREPADCAFLAFHGQYGEDGAVQGLLQTAGIPYTGSGILASALAYNKAASLGIFTKAGLPIARSVVCTTQNPYPKELADLTYPLFTKPVCGGSSLGVTLVKSRDGLNPGIDHALAHDDSALAEEKINGVEVSCGVMDFILNGEIVSRPLPPTLISPCDAEYFDYEAKYVPGKSRDVTPAPLPEPLIARIQDIALAAHKALGCEGMSRTDLITLEHSDAEPVILETQTLPGMTPTSLIPQQCAAAGITFADFIELLIENALWRHKIKRDVP